MIALPSYVDPELWSMFVSARKEGKHPLTQSAEKMAVRKLMRLHEDGWDVNKSLEESILKGYRGLFEAAKRPVETKTEVKAYQVSDQHIEAAVAPSSDLIRKMKERMYQK